MCETVLMDPIVMDNQSWNFQSHFQFQVPVRGFYTLKWDQFVKVSKCVLKTIDPIGYFFKWAKPGLFFLYFLSFQTNNRFYYKKSMCKNVQMSIQYTAPGFEPTTFQTWVVTHNHSFNVAIKINELRTIGLPNHFWNKTKQQVLFLSGYQWWWWHLNWKISLIRQNLQ